MPYNLYHISYMVIRYVSYGQQIPYKVKNDHLNERLAQKELETKQILSTYEGWRSQI